MAWMAVAASVAGSVISGAMADDSAGSASGAQSQADAMAIEEQKRQYDVTRRDLAPWRNAGGQAVNRLSTLLGLGGSEADKKAGIRNTSDVSPIAQKYFDAYGITDNDWYKLPPDVRWEIYDSEKDSRSSAATAPDPNDPEYGALNKKFTLADFWDDPVTKASFDFGLAEGTKALGNMAGARGNRNSGAQLKALERFATDYTGGQAAASSGRFYGDQDRTFNRLSGVAGTGQTAATNTAMAGQNTANTVGGILSAGGNARGAAAIAGGNAMGGTLQNVGNTLSNWWNRQQQPNNNYNSSGAFQPYYSMSSDNYG